MICPYCGKEFTQNHGLQKYCSNECQTRNSRLNWVKSNLKISNQTSLTKVCIDCNKKFVTKNPKLKRCYSCRQDIINAREDGKRCDDPPTRSQVCMSQKWRVEDGWGAEITSRVLNMTVRRVEEALETPLTEYEKSVIRANLPKNKAVLVI